MILKKGSKGVEVTELQKLLKHHGFYDGPVDGDFGATTDRAVRQFQASANLKADGLVGSRTWSELRVVSRLSPGEADKAYLLGLLGTLNGVRRRAIELAIADLGKKEDPPGSNDGPEIRHLTHRNGQSYNEYIGVTGSAPPWCMLAAGSWMEAAGSYPFPQWFGAVSQLESWGKARGGRFMGVDVKLAWHPGSAFVMGRKASGSDEPTALQNGHTGLVVADDGAYIITIEGNTGNAVAWQRRQKSTLRGYVVWW